MSFQCKFAVPLFMVLSFFMLSVLDFDLALAEDPTSKEQLFIFELNRARHNPTQFQTENSLSVDLSAVAAQPPLAVNGDLTGSAGFKAQEMADNNYFAHESPISGWPNALARSFGYNLASFLDDNTNNIESIAAGFNPVTDWTQPLTPLVTLIVDEGVPSLGHRIHLLAMNSFNQRFREIGVGYGSNSSSTLKNYWVIHTGFDDNDGPFLTGVVYSDANGNSRFDLNEGLSGVTVSVVGGIPTTTNSAGGWSIRSGSGSKTVQCSGGSFVGAGTANFTVGSDNLEVDFISGNSSGVVNFGAGGGIVTTTTSTIPPTTQPIAATITANNSSGTVNLNVGGNLSVDCSLDSGSFAGQNADWWVAAETPSGWFYFDVGSKLWVLAGSSHTDLFSTFQGPLFDLSPFEVLNTSGLSAGTYTFYFAVDTNMNGVLDLGELFFDFVVVNITP